MRLENAVSKRKRPWYMEPIEHQRGHLSKLTGVADGLARELSETGIVVIRKSVPAAICDGAREDFYLFCSLNKVRLEPARDGHGRLRRLGGRRSRIPTPNRRLHAGQHLLRMARLRDPVVGAEAQPSHSLSDGAGTGTDDHDLGGR